MRFAPRRVDKPWGYELIWAQTDRYVGKILHIDAGHALSLQYHRAKDEIFYVLRGELRVLWGASADALEEVSLKEGESFHVEAGVIHRTIALTDVDLLEASTGELDDIVRLDDRYGRA